MQSIRVRHLRHRSLERTRHSTNFLSWLNAQATRLEQTADEIFDALKAGATSQEIEAMPTPEPEPTP